MNVKQGAELYALLTKRDMQVLPSICTLMFDKRPYSWQIGTRKDRENKADHSFENNTVRNSVLYDVIG